MKSPHLLLIFLFAFPVTVLCQSDLDSSVNRKPFEYRINQASILKKEYRYAEALAELKKAASFIKVPQHEYQLKIKAAEIFRITADYPKAFELLWSIKETENDELEIYNIRRLGRLAALHHEFIGYKNVNGTDSVLFFIDAALTIAEAHPEKYQKEIAGLKNELGFYRFRGGFNDAARKLYTESATIYQGQGDAEYYADVLNNLLELEVVLENTVQADSILAILADLTKGNSWLHTNVRMYNSQILQAEIDGDSTAYWKYKFFKTKNIYELNTHIYDENMVALREQFEHEKLEKNIAREEEKSRKNELALVEERESKNRLIYYVIIALVFVLLSVVIIMRERKRRKQLKHTNYQLNVSNNDYQMLIRESNHRIKNNLQMIASMVDYSGAKASVENQALLENISGQIQTISALHRHLHFNIHNEQISMRVYFQEIVDNYQTIHDGQLPIQFNVAEVGINSERLIYFGLILNELMANTIKHNDNSTIRIKIHVLNDLDKFIFVYQDKQQLPEKFEMGTGVQLIKDLVARVEGDNLRIDYQNGQYKFSFNA